MVSLSRSMNTGSGGATFFSESANMDDRENIQFLESYDTFKPVKTIPVVVLFLLASAGLYITALTLDWLQPGQNGECFEYFLLVYLHIGFCGFSAIVEFALKCAHLKVRHHGYLEFYNKINIYGYIPLYSACLYTVALLLLQTIMQQFYLHDFPSKCNATGIRSPTDYISLFILAETITLFVVFIFYIKKVWQFNKAEAPADVQREDWQRWMNQENGEQAEVGYREVGDRVHELLERQADLIQHLKEHNARLSEKLITMSAQLQQARSGGGARSVE